MRHVLKRTAVVAAATITIAELAWITVLIWGAFQLGQITAVLLHLDYRPDQIEQRPGVYGPKVNDEDLHRADHF